MNILTYFIAFTLQLFSIHAIEEYKGALQLKISNVQANTGSVKIAIHNLENSFPSDISNAFLLKEISVENQEEILVDFQIEFGEYAITIYQDLNSNNILDKGIFGIPKEPWACSGIKSKGPPKYESAKFNFDRDGMKINVELND